MKNEIVFALSLALASTAACTPASSPAAGDDSSPVTGGKSGGGGSKASGGAGAGGSAGSSTGGAAGPSGGSPGSGGATSGSGGAADSGGSAGDAGAPVGDPDAGQSAGDSGSTLPPPVPGEVGAPGFPGWKYTKSIKMDTTAAGAGVTGNVANYPVAVVLNATNFDFSQTKPQGEDVRFGKADGTPMPYAIESYDQAGKAAVFWVKIDQVLGNDATQSFNMYWGKADAGLAGDSKQVFGAGFLGVWHLNEDAASTPDGFKDSSATGSHATGVNVMPGARVEGAIGKGVKLINAMRQWVKVEDDMKHFRPDNMTASLWGWADGFPAKWGADGSPGYQTIFSSGEGWTVQRETGAKFESCFDGANCAIGKGMNAKEWVHFTLIRAGNSSSLYMNAVKVSGAGATNTRPGKPLGIGQQTQYLDPIKNKNEQRSWEGILDEARVMNVASSTDWIKLEYESQRPGSKFLNFGATQTK